MTTRTSVRRFLARTVLPVLPVGAGGLTLALMYCTGAPLGGVATVGATVSTVVGALPQLLPQESEHRRDVWRDLLLHRERMARLRINAAQARLRTTGGRPDRNEVPS
ncbi:hypothetical protein AB0L75_38305 [Streptomyces sp. NPDC052101]|uniref:hypothetical protein n=1 Tax=Streptomyces sp. NPDC052101 TaxID=3155763 RepID=UPI0034375914